MNKLLTPIHIIIEEGWTSNKHVKEIQADIESAGHLGVTPKYVIRRLKEMNKIYQKETIK